MTFISSELQAALGAAIGPANVLGAAEADRIATQYGANVSGLQRTIAGVVRPQSRAHVCRLVAIANRFAAREAVHLYPISRGKNWGLGSKLPVREGAIVVDLSGMDKIHAIDETFGYAVIEPGVTQQQLYDALQKCRRRLMFNVTGSGTGTSILGNCLDRGVGYLATRADDISNLEVVLGNGTVVQTGFGHMHGVKAQNLYRYGIGPDITGAFVQSNFGIVTRATFALHPVPAQQAALLCGLKDAAALAPFIDRLAALRRDGVIGTAFHIGNADRFRSTLVPQLREQLRQRLDPAAAQRLAEAVFEREMRHAWSAIGTVQGTRRAVNETARHVRRALSAFGPVQLITDARLSGAMRLCRALRFADRFALRLPFLESLAAVYGLTKGIPTDMPLKSLAWDSPTPPADFREPDAGTIGLLFTTPLIPMDGSSAADVLAITRGVFRTHGFTPYITFNMCNARSMEGVINLLFDRRRAAATERAHRCIADVTRQLRARGYPPYRIGVQGMDLVIEADDPYWQTVGQIKDAFDPNNIIAPGRYSLR